MAKHFIKALATFIAIIVLVLGGFVIVNYIEQNSEQATVPTGQAHVA